MHETNKDLEQAGGPKKKPKRKKGSKKRWKIGSPEAGLDWDQIQGCAGFLFAPIRLVVKGAIKLLGDIADAD